MTHSTYGDEQQLPYGKEIWAQAKEHFTRNAKEILSVSALFALVALFGQIALTGMLVLAGSDWMLSQNFVASIVGITFVSAAIVIGSIFFGIWGYSAMTAVVVGEHVSFREALHRGLKLFWPLVWLYTVYTTVAFGGLILFILPGIYLFVMCAFAPYLLYTDNERGLSAVVKSREYIRGRFWHVFTRSLYGVCVVLLWWLLAAVVVVGLPSLAIYLLLPQAPWLIQIPVEFFNFVSSILITPAFLALSYIVLTHLKATRTLAADAGTTSRGWFIFFGVVGIVASVLILMLMATSDLLVTQVFFTELGQSF
jgi:hypothetical protein